jgi:hypothetical protein
MKKRPMAIIDEVIEAKFRKAVEVLNRNVTVAAAYLFGSQVTGKTDRWSALDLAIFADGIEGWDLKDRARQRSWCRKKQGMMWEFIFSRPMFYMTGNGIQQALPAGFFQVCKLNYNTPQQIQKAMTSCDTEL